ncbi:MAG: circularly permuted type 2 ATP-grasp protein [Lewinella sp.]|nr:circularly permuted type 2 ATP-grasp protein [Lewinella sp.]
MIPSNSTTDLLQGYEQSKAAFDEMWEGPGRIRTHWQHLLQQIQALGPNEMGHRKLELQRLLRDHGVTYNIYGSPQGARQLWKLDPIPYVLPQSTWDRIERGLQQRAQLLNLILADLYGERRLIRSGVLPVELIYSDRNFLRACDQVLAGQTQQLLLYAADLSRGPDGNIWVIGDRTQAPSGWSYTMENRIAMARALPELFANNHVRKIAPFYQQSRNALARFAPHDNTDPRIVMLTPGSMNETYFEHAYLAALQGFVLVQGRDLMVKDNFVWLKTLGGLEKVDIIVRRVDDSYCDPLALRADSQLGVAGLLEAARAGNVRIANPLGSGILENPGLLAFMPSISRYFLSEELILPNLASWWCGQPRERQYVLEHLDQLVIKQMDRRAGQRTVFGWQLTRVQREELQRKINAFPYLYIAQEQAVFSSSPAFDQQQLTARHTVLRCFAFAGESDYEVLSGGLTRSAPEAGNKHVSGQSGGSSKDTWVLSKEPVRPIRYQATLPPGLTQFKQLQDLPSSAAENLFWVGRYGNRILYIARLLRIVLKYRAEIENFDDASDTEIYHVLLQALTHITVTYPGFVGKEGQRNLAQPEQELRAIMLDPTKIGGLTHAIRMWKNGANAIRNRWSTDTWRIFDQVEEDWEHLMTDPSTNMLKIRSALDQLVYNISALVRLTHGSMSQEEGRSLFGIGMDLEYSLLMSAMLRATVVVKREPSIASSILEAILLNNHSLTTYRHRYRHYLQLDRVLDLILLDATYPQSMAFALQRLGHELDHLPKTGQPGKLRDDQKLILKTYTDLQLVETTSLVQTDDESVLLEDLDALLASVRQDLSKAADAITHTFFAHTGKAAQQALLLFNPDL